MRRLLLAIQNQLGGRGTANTLPRFTAATKVGDSGLSDDGTTLTSTRPLLLPAIGGSTPAQHQGYRESFIKAWAHVEAADGSPEVMNHLNISGVADNGVGDYTYTIDRDFADALYAMAPCIIGTPNNDRNILCHTPAVGSIRFIINQGGTPADYDHAFILAGDQ